MPHHSLALVATSLTSNLKNLLLYCSKRTVVGRSAQAEVEGPLCRLKEVVKGHLVGRIRVGRITLGRSATAATIRGIFQRIAGQREEDMRSKGQRDRRETGMDKPSKGQYK
jgi:hypothetical protein